MSESRRSNKFAADCANCDSTVPAGEGILEKDDGQWVVTCEVCDTVGDGASTETSRRQPSHKGGTLAAGNYVAAMEVLQELVDTAVKPYDRAVAEVAIRHLDIACIQAGSHPVCAQVDDNGVLVAAKANLERDLASVLEFATSVFDVGEEDLLAAAVTLAPIGDVPAKTAEDAASRALKRANATGKAKATPKAAKGGKCERCDGSGEYKNFGECFACKGTGNQPEPEECKRCDGTGEYKNFGECFQCEGTGKYVPKKGGNKGGKRRSRR